MGGSPRFVADFAAQNAGKEPSFECEADPIWPAVDPPEIQTNGLMIGMELFRFDEFGSERIDAKKECRSIP